MTSTATTPDTTAATDRRAGLSGAFVRRWATGAGVAATAASLSVLAPLPERVQTYVSAWCVLLAAVIYLTWGTARGDLASRRLLSLQTAAVLGFGAIAIAAVATDPTVARYVLAAGWLAHAAWDIAHHRANRVVPRWYAETCLVSDLIIAAALLTVGP
ncbi:DUF6010 family protein [Sphaerisporangium perillae]|uniref:DUF6010 family protein n=1 Tax=Sphaerisporangium perillae TaxID=2935860 RepID=UPI00200F23E1|nr:DUF6010 family protein [Sphaerisporangium perillae]